MPVRTLAAILSLPFLCRAADELRVDLVTPEIVQSRLYAGVVGHKERQRQITELFANAGCQSQDQLIDRHTGNVICTLPGETKSAIVVGGHLDFVERGQGIVDDWTGSSMLPSLYQALKSQPREAQKADVKAFVNLECLGLSIPKVWLSRATRDLAILLTDVSRTLNIDLQAVNVDRAGDDDTHPLLNAHLPVITIHSLTPDNFSILQSIRDRGAAVNQTIYYSTYRLVAFYLAYLDHKID